MRLSGTGGVAGRTVYLPPMDVYETFTISIPVALVPAGRAMAVFTTGSAGAPVLFIDGVAGTVTAVKFPIWLISTSDAEKGMFTVKSPAAAVQNARTERATVNLIFSPVSSGK